MSAFWSNVKDVADDNKINIDDGDDDKDDERECCIRTMLRTGEWQLTEPQPSSLYKCVLSEQAPLVQVQGRWVPCAELVSVGSVTKSEGKSTQKKVFVCGLCGCQKSKEVHRAKLFR